MTYRADDLPSVPESAYKPSTVGSSHYCQPLVAASRSVEVLDLLLNHGENGAWRVAGLELGGEWVSKKIFLGLFFGLFQGIIEYQLEVGGRCRRRASKRYDGGSEGFILRALGSFKH